MKSLVNPQSNQFRLLSLLGGFCSVLGALLLLAALLSLVMVLTGVNVFPFNAVFGMAYLSYGISLLVGGQVLLWLVAMWQARYQSAP
jgi:hypothetical protein